MPGPREMENFWKSWVARWSYALVLPTFYHAFSCSRRCSPLLRLIIIISCSDLCGLIHLSAHQQVGTYNPIANSSGIKEVRLKTDRLRYWISVGAQPSDRVAWLLGKFGILPTPPPKFNPQKMIPKKDRKEKWTDCWHAKGHFNIISNYGSNKLPILD